MEIMAKESEVKITLDTNDEGEAGGENQESQKDQEKGGEGTPNGTTVLLVDDDTLILQMYQKKLEADGYSVKTATNGSQALSDATSEQPSMIFLDVVVADMNGIEILKKLKSDPKTKKIPVIMLTNFSDKPEDIEGAKKVGALDYLIKAKTDPQMLSARVKKVLETGT